MTQLPPWLGERLRCPQTGAALAEESRAGVAVYVARPEGKAPIYYEVDNGVPILLPQ